MKPICGAVPFLGVLLLACQPAAPVSRTAESASASGKLAYQSSVNGVPADWKGHVFALNADYPRRDPGKCPPQECKWLARKMNFNESNPEWRGEWVGYMNDILEYVRKGQSLTSQHWNTHVGSENRWFHVPWMAYDQIVGREFIHGMTNERTAHLADLLGVDKPVGVHTLPRQSTSRRFESWAFGVYNPWGGYAIGRTFDSNGVPVLIDTPNGALPAGLPFPEGSLVVKLLFTTADESEVYFLRNSPAWTVDRHIQTSDTTFSCKRSPQQVRLVQMDVAVVDERSPTRWVLGTFAYNGTLKASDPWDRMSPVGLQWGSDPGTYPAVPREQSRPVRQTVLAPIDIYEHHGCEGRMNGPVDSKTSSCISCHQGAFAAPVGTVGTLGKNLPPIFGFAGMCTGDAPENRTYFQNIRYPQPYPDPKYSGAIPLDLSLQLQVAFQEYGQYKTYGEPERCSQR